MKLLPEVRLRPKNNRLDFRDDYDTDPGSGLRSGSIFCMTLSSGVCLGQRTNLLNSGDDPDCLTDYDE